MNEDLLFPSALSLVAQRCADCKGDWAWLDNPSIKGDANRLVIVRQTVRDVVANMVDDPLTGEEIYHQLQYQFFQVLYPNVVDRIHRMAFRDWIETLAESLGWTPTVAPRVAAAAPPVKPPVKNTKADPEVVSSDSDDDENEKKEEGDRVDYDNSGSSPMSYDSQSPVDRHDSSSYSSPPPPSPPVSVSIGAAAPMDQDETTVPSSPMAHRPVDPPRRSPSQVEADEAFQAKVEAVQGEPIVVLPSSQSAAAAASEPQSEDPRPAGYFSPVEMKVMADDDAAAAVSPVPPRNGGGKYRPALAEPASRKAKSKRQKTGPRRLPADQKTALQSPRTTRSADKIKTRASDAQSSHPAMSLSGWPDEASLTLT